VILVVRRTRCKNIFLLLPLVRGQQCPLTILSNDNGLDREALREKCKESLYFLAKGVLGFDWLVPHVHMSICQTLEDPSINRALFVLPRGWLKTTVCTVSYPIFESLNDPNTRVLLTQNSATNACKKLSQIGDLWTQNELLRWLFPELLPRRDSTWRADSMCLSRTKSFPESTYEAAGTNTKVTSRHYNTIIEDDTVAPDFDELGAECLAPTHDDVQKAIGWHRTNTIPLLTNPGTDKILVVGTRWYDEDLIRWIVDHEPHYKITTRACLEDSDGNPDMNGIVTYPERFNREVLQQIEDAQGPYMFSCLYQNTPVRSEDMLFKPEWIEYYDVLPHNKSLMVFTTVDMATDPELARTKDIDYSVVMTCGKDMHTGQIFVIDYFRQRCNPGELASAIYDHVVKYHPVVVGYEDIGFQRSMEYWLKELMRREGRYFLLEPVKFSSKQKEVKIAALQPLFSNKLVRLKTWMKELVSELLKFPLGKHDDLADALSMQLSLWRTTKKYMPKKVEYEDPMTLEYAIEELHGRAKGKFGSLIFDPSRSGRVA